MNRTCAFRLESGIPRSPQVPSGNETRLQLLRRARRGDRAALDELFGRHLPSLRRWAHGRLGGWARTLHDTSDLIQDVALKTMQRLGSFEPQGERALQAYLRQAVRNQIADQYRRIAVRGLRAELDESIADQGPSPHDTAVGADVEARYRRALALLTERDRELVVGRVELGYSHQQLAAMSGRRSADSARVALHRALIKLAEGMAGG